MYAENNLQVLCKWCHRDKTRGEYGGPLDPERVAWDRLLRELTT